MLQDPAIARSLSGVFSYCNKPFCLIGKKAATLSGGRYQHISLEVGTVGQKKSEVHRYHCRIRR